MKSNDGKKWVMVGLGAGEAKFEALGRKSNKCRKKRMVFPSGAEWLISLMG
tara:strand:- start:170 stop:322 length:153 start_codon:yes stop_codon:yes gene_type:complete